jgi:hypothetical protein
LPFKILLKISKNKLNFRTHITASSKVKYDNYSLSIGNIIIEIMTETKV